ncbi:inner membrane protein [Paenimyroides ummariense]|uniref:Inner membrane protein n=1 Tax=Paenimyroides ummariense TaxID=913024 RepID=A0A1I5D384_9FLAO|nr:metal-dependent hydrolase [Paenimyroides ummariense]SFN93689.1 inner membrane protein [Paenimyroides ummariense]
MDSFTQIVLGVSVAHVALNKSVGTKKIVLLGAVVATLPDLDIYIAKIFNDPLTEIEIHRGFSHSILFFLLLSVAITYLLKKAFKETTKKQLFITTFLILLTHSLLDVFTTWGTQLFWPFPEKIALKSIFVVDLFYTIPLLMGVVLGLMNKRKTFTYAGLILSSLYLIWGLIIQQVVKSRVEGQFYTQYPSKNIKATVKPTFSNSFLWNVIVQDVDGFYISDYSIFDSKQMTFQYFPQNKKLIDHLNDDNINRLKEISENQYIITKNKNGLVFNDLRFGLLKNTDNEVQFAFSYQLILTENGYSVKELPKDKRDGMQLLKNIWYRIFNI